MSSDEKMTVFISWSQKLSHDIAEILQEKLYTLFNEKIEFWVSSNIPAGNFFVNDIISALQRSAMGIICLDRSNYKKPWINFETGVIFGCNYKENNPNQSIVFPIIFDDLKVESFSGTPLGNMQLQQFNKTRMKRVVNEINNMYQAKTGENIYSQNMLTTFFDSIWPDLNAKICNVIDQAQEGANENMLTESNVADKLRNYRDFPNPISAGNILRYGSGFETQEFYEFLLENVTTRLYIFGRKNSKLGRNDLAKKFSKLMSGNVEVKLLFLNPLSEKAEGRHAQNIPDFKNALITSIVNYNEKLSNMKLDIADFCRMYSTQRDCEFIIADHVVFYKELSYDDDGLPKHFTGESFSVVATENQLGSSYLQKFDKIWAENENNKITKEFITTLRN